MAKNKYMQKLQKLSGAVTGDEPDPFSTVISTKSPSFNYLYGPRGDGLPRGYTEALIGEPGGGKTVLTNMMIAGAHQQYPNDNQICIKFDTEHRTVAQTQSAELAISMGVDFDRLQTYQVNTPKEVFDRISKEIYALHQDGMDVPLIVIDSVNGITGMLGQNAGSIDDLSKLMGDKARTLANGFAQILPVIRKMNTALILTAQIRSDIGDKGKYEKNAKQYKGMLIKPALSLPVLHFAEYWTYIQKVGGNKAFKDAKGANNVWDNEHEFFGHRIKAQRIHASFGSKGRTAEFALDYTRGVVDTHEELYELALYTGVIYKKNPRTHEFRNTEWPSYDACLSAIENDPDLQTELWKEIRSADMNGVVKAKFMGQESEESSSDEQESDSNSDSE